MLRQFSISQRQLPSRHCIQPKPETRPYLLIDFDHHCGQNLQCALVAVGLSLGNWSGAGVGLTKWQLLRIVCLLLVAS